MALFEKDVVAHHNNYQKVEGHLLLLCHGRFGNLGLIHFSMAITWLCLKKDVAVHFKFQ
jgi:hypothetical protein